MNTRKTPIIYINLLFYFVILLILLTFFPRVAKAKTLECEDRFLTLVNPVRDRSRWQDRSLAPIKEQYESIKERNFAATWLIQYEVLNDKELVEELKDFNNRQEIGLFLEISKGLVYDSKVIYPHAKPWTDPSALFLSGYSQSERVKIINKLFSDFKNTFGYYPKSIGAWWIDSYSLNYMESKYGIDAVLVVADQKTTDKYGVWGQWWGVPYYPAIYNLLKPAVKDLEKSDYVVIQWAQRDLTKAYGNDFTYSNYSLQANDYLERGLGTEYFEDLTSTYLNCNIPLGQITVGLETGIEGFTFFDEYQKQLDYLGEIEGLRSVTMSEFFDFYKKKYDSNPQRIVLSDSDSNWILTKNERVNKFLGEKIDYTNIKSFSDYFIADKNSFLNRRLNDGNLGSGEKEYIEIFYLPFIFALIYALVKGQFKAWFSAAAFIIAAFGYLLRSDYQHGWKVFYGPVADNLDFVNLIITTIVFALFFLTPKFVKKSKQFDLSLLYIVTPLTFGLDTIIRLLRYTNIEGKHYLGLIVKTFDFYGFSYPNFSIETQKFSHVVAGAMIKFNMDKIWSSLTLSVIVYPFTHVLAALFLYYLFGKLKPKLRLFILFLLIILSIGHLYYIFTADPRAVVQI